MEKTGSVIEQIGDKLFEEFKRAVPLNPQRLRGKKVSEAEIRANTEVALRRFYDAARAERARHKLGLLARARVAFALQQRMLSHGYPAPLVKQVLFAMLTSVFIGRK
ncbi:MAG TPA: hypothetical protein VIM12_06840 [Noviherbaspirillum sp.]|jgi:hypothetical protein|uniref:hypothetical protein n=1 Tax=Noviherbaspirillum sp. TaxID=1926288 RepID=UPI002F92F45B